MKFLASHSVLSFVLQGLIAVACFASIPVVIRLVSADPMTIGFIRLVITVGLGFFILVTPRKLINLTRRDWMWLVVLGFSFGFHWLTYFYSIKMANASTAVVGISSYGIQLILISIFLHGRPFYKTDAVAILAVVIGEFMVVPEFSLQNELTLGFLIAIGSAFFYAILPSIHQKNSHIDSGTRSFGQFLFAGVFFALFLPEMNFELTHLDWVGLLYLSIVATLVAHSLWIRVTTHVAAMPASLMYYLSVPGAIILSVVVLHEELTWKLIFGTSLILVGNFFGIIHQVKNKSFFINASHNKA